MITFHGMAGDVGATSGTTDVPFEQHTGSLGEMQENNVT